MAVSIIRCTLSGSFRRDNAGLKRAYRELITCGCQVLSPHRLEFDSTDVLFVKDKAEQSVSEQNIEAHHLLAIRQSDFLWVHIFQGYVGLSAAYEIGYAAALGVPVFASSLPTESMLQSSIRVVPSVFSALEILYSDE